MNLNKMTREDFENLPLIDDNVFCDGLIFLPTKRKNDSGYAMFYACPTFEQKVLGKCELHDVFDVRFNNDLAKIDCLYASKLIRLQFSNTYKLISWLHWLEKGE